MPIPRIAIVGRPNVGKSSLLNLIAGERIAIVDPTPGVTRDRLSTIVELEGPGGAGPDQHIEVIDTGGFGVYVAEGKRYDEIGADLATLTSDIERQIAAAVGSADLILFAIDTQAGVTSQDQAIAKMLREQRLGSRERDGRDAVPVVVMATKVDSDSWEPHAYEAAGLGFGEPLMCSSKTKYMRRVMLEKLYTLARQRQRELDERYGQEAPLREVDLKIAIVGKRNAGKSTLVNTLAGEQRVIVSEIAGTTRDAIDVRFDFGDRSVLAIDTAGLRRKKSFQDLVEVYAFDRAKRAIARADVVLMMIDATADISQVDEQLGELIKQSHKPVAIVINKWDLAEGKTGRDGKPVGVSAYERYVRRELKGLSFAPIAFMSAKGGMNVQGVLDLAFDLKEQATTRVPTAQMNRLVRGLVEHRPTSDKHGRRGRCYFATQVRTEPPTIVMIVNQPETFGGDYERWLMNQFREHLPFPEVPIRLFFRDKRRAEKALAEREREEAKRLRKGKRKLHTVGDDGSFETDFGATEDDLDALLRNMPDDPDLYFGDDGGDDPGDTTPARDRSRDRAPGNDDRGGPPHVRMIDLATGEEEDFSQEPDIDPDDGPDDGPDDEDGDGHDDGEGNDKGGNDAPDRR